MLRVLILLLFLFTACNLLNQKQTVDTEQQASAGEEKPKVKKKLNRTKSFSKIDVAEYSKSKVSLYQEILANNLQNLKDQELITDAFLYYAKKYKLDPILILSIAKNGSSLNPNYTSKQKYGLVPVSISQADFIAKLYNLDFSSKKDLLNPQTNIAYAVSSLKFYMELYRNNVEQSLLAFNWGIDSLEGFLDSSDPLPQVQKKFLLGVLEGYKDLYTSKPEAVSEATPLPTSEPELEVTSTPSPIPTVEPTPDPSPEPAPSVIKSQATPVKIKASYLLGQKGGSEPDQYKEYLKSRFKASGSLSKHLDTLVEISLSHNIDPIFIAALVQVESNFNSIARKGSKIGLMQIDSKQAEYIAKLVELDWEGEEALISPTYNLKLGIAYLKLCHEIFDNNPVNALAGYNWGLKNLISALKNNSRIPSKISKYPYLLMKEYKQWQAEMESFEKDQELSQKETIDSNTEVAQPSSTASKQIPKEIEKGDKLSVIKQYVCIQTQGAEDCKRIAETIYNESQSYQVDPLIVAALAKRLSRFNPALQVDQKYGLFQISEKQAHSMVKFAKVTWAGKNELLNLEYSLRLSCKYLWYLSKRYRDRLKYIIPAFVWGNADQLSTAVKEKKAIPNSINTKSIQVIKDINFLKSKIR